MKKIPLTQGKFAIVDDEDYECLMQWKWSYNQFDYGSAHRRMRYSEIGAKKNTTITMHRHILGNPPGIIDHINRNRLDNRRSNLRIVTHVTNAWNRGVRRDSSSGYKGVKWNKSRGKWEVGIQAHGKRIWLGFFTDKHEAARVYNQAAKELHGEYAYQNAIEQP